MKVEAITKLLAGVIDKFIKDMPREIQDIFMLKSYITGGCIPSMAMGEFVNDYDVYFMDKQSVDKIKEYFGKIEVEQHDGQSKHSFKINLITDNAINLDNKLQLITKYYGKDHEIIGKFDWAHIKSCYSYPDTINLCDDFYRYIVEKELVYTGSDYPLSSLLRTRKFIKKGWHVSTKTMTHIALDVAMKFRYVPDRYKRRLFTEDLFEDEEAFQKYQEAIEPLREIWEDEPDEPEMINRVTLIEQLNGVDPLTIQARLLQHTGEYLTIDEIIKMM